MLRICKRRQTCRERSRTGPSRTVAPMSVQDQVVFLQQLKEGFETIGALFPTSTPACRALVADVARHQGPKTILEVGCGTGAVTQELINLLGPDDKLVLCELNEKFVHHLQHRFETESGWANVAHQVEFYTGSATDLEGEDRFDYIISTLPFTSLPADLVDTLFTRYRQLLKPAGVLTYIEYAYLRSLRTQLTPGDQMRRTNKILDEQIANFQFRRESVGANLPPAWVRSLRFAPAKPEQALEIKPLRDRKRLKLGPFALSTESLGLLAGLGLASYFMKKNKMKGWLAPLALAGATAWFHRDPERAITVNHSLAYSACDGEVLGVEKIRHPRLGDADWLRINVFLGLTDVHINRAPVAGIVDDSWEEPGGHSPAFRSEANGNSSRYIVIEGTHGKIAVAQRAGALARTILTWCQKGELLCQGERYGLIRLGSRTDVYLPADGVTILVNPGDRVVAGRTPLARFETPEPDAS